MGTQGVHELHASQPPNPYHSKSPYTNTPPPSYSAHSQSPLPPSQQPYGYPPYQQYPEKPPHPQAMAAPYPQSPPAGYYPNPTPMPQPHRQQSGYLGVPPQHHRSHSQPARVRFADQESEHSTNLGSIPAASSCSDSGSDSDDYSRPRRQSRHHHHHHCHHHHHSSPHRPHRSHSRPHDRTYDSSSPSDRDRDRDRDRESSSRRHKPRKSRSYDKPNHDKTRDTFLGAGAGTLIGDVLFPGLGTAAGLVLGGYGGRKYAQEKARGSDDNTSNAGGANNAGPRKRHQYHSASRRAGEDGWDERSATYRKGGAVR